MAVAMVALFMSMGGVGYAAISIPDNSVGTAQLKDNAVSYKKIVPGSVGIVRLANNGVSTSKLRNRSVSFRKIQPGAVGHVRANLNQLQARVTGTCAAGSAVASVDIKGAVTCNPARPSQLGTTDNTAAVTATAADVSTLTLPAGSSYMVFANPQITVTGTGTGTGQVTTVSCTLTVGSNKQTRAVTVDTPGTSDTRTVTFPLEQAGPAGPSSVSCAASVPSGDTLTAVSATSAINAVQIAG